MSYEERFEAKCQGAILQMFEWPSFSCRRLALSKFLQESYLALKRCRGHQNPDQFAKSNARPEPNIQSGPEMVT
jgi:hypothetical protein